MTPSNNEEEYNLDSKSQRRFQEMPKKDFEEEVMESEPKGKSTVPNEDTAFDEQSKKELLAKSCKKRKS